MPWTALRSTTFACINEAAIFTVAIGKDPYHRTCLGPMRSYAERIGADFVMREETDLPTVYAEKFRAGELLDPYERVLIMDSDVLLRREAPDIFAAHPDPEFLYAFFIHHLYEAVQLAKGIGCDVFHAHPAWLPAGSHCATMIDESRRQILQARFPGRVIQGLRCHAQVRCPLGDEEWFSALPGSLLTVAFDADGNLHICSDRRGEENMVMEPYLPLTKVYEIWGGERHRTLLRGIDLADCPRCTFGP